MPFFNSIGTPKSYLYTLNPMIEIAKILAGLLSMSLMAQIEFNIGEVPITGQSLGVLLVGGLLGPRLAALCMLLYLCAGAVGLPVFAGGSSGTEVLTGKTAGFLYSFVPAAALSAYLRFLWGADFLKLLINFTLATGLILSIGCLWLAYHLGWQTSFKSVLPSLLPGAGIKVFMAAIIVSVLMQVVGQNRLFN